MDDREFSSPGPEFSPPPEEFSKPGPEFSSPGPEFSGSDPTPPRKKRRIPALMMAAAAVVLLGFTVLTGGWDGGTSPSPSPSPSGGGSVVRPSALPSGAPGQLPTGDLTADQAAYLDALVAALRAGDEARTETLLEEPDLVALCEGALVPFADALSARGLDGSAVSSDYGDSVHFYGVYDGENLIAPSAWNSGDGWVLRFSCTVSKSTSARDGESAVVGAGACLTEDLAASRQGRPYTQTAYQHLIREFENSTVIGTEFYQLRLCAAELNGVSGTAALSGIRHDSQWDSSMPQCAYERTMEGECSLGLWGWSGRPEGYELSSFLENGAVTARMLDGRAEVVIPVIDGLAQLDDSLAVNIINNTCQLDWSPDGSVTIGLGWGGAEEGSNPLYHLFTLLDPTFGLSGF